jgi:hypothetical protein
VKLSENDKALLTKWGYPESDFSQIEEAMKKSKTKYELEGFHISREEAIDLLGREEYLSGIARSAFHYTAARETANNKVVYFDSSNLFK